MPLGGGGLVPNLRSGNVDAVVLYSPLSFEMMQAKQARMLIDYCRRSAGAFGGRLGRHRQADRRQAAVVQKAMNALYGGLAWLRANRDAAIALIAEVDEIKPEIAAMEYEQHHPEAGDRRRLRPDEMQRALDMGEADRHHRHRADRPDHRPTVSSRSAHDRPAA